MIEVRSHFLPHWIVIVNVIVIVIVITDQSHLNQELSKENLEKIFKSKIKIKLFIEGQQDPE